MAGQGIKSGPREAAWVIKPREGSEFLYRRCHDCGEIRREPSHGVIRVNDEQFSEWCRISTSGREWDLGIVVSIPAVIGVVVAVLFGGVALIRPEPTDSWFYSLIAAAAVAGAATWYLTTFQMFRYNKKVGAERREKEAAFLKPLTGLDPHQVGIPQAVGAPQIVAMLLPAGVYDELSYYEYED